MPQPTCDFGRFDDRCTENFRIPPRGFYTVCDKHVDQHVPPLDFNKCQGSFYGHAGEISWGPDPFAAEIHEDYAEMWLCDSCQHESSMEI